MLGLFVYTHFRNATLFPSVVQFLPDFHPSHTGLLLSSFILKSLVSELLADLFSLTCSCCLAWVAIYFQTFEFLFCLSVWENLLAANGLNISAVYLTSSMLIPPTDVFFHASIKKSLLAYVKHRAAYTHRKYSCRMLKILRHRIALVWEPCRRDEKPFLSCFCCSPLITWLCLPCSPAHGRIQQASTGDCLEILWLRNTPSQLRNIPAAFYTVLGCKDSSTCWPGGQETGPQSSRSVPCTASSFGYAFGSFLWV